MNYALDACAMIAYLRGERGGTVVEGFLNNPSDTCYAHTINLLEVYYDFIRKHNEPVARQALKDLATIGVVVRRTMSQKFTRRVGQLKAQGGISLADCFCIVLAQEIRVKSSPVTTMNSIHLCRSVLFRSTSSVSP